MASTNRNYDDNLDSMYIAHGEELESNVFPELYNLSAAFFHRFVPRPHNLNKPEFLYIPIKGIGKNKSNYNLSLYGMLHEWNGLWEAGQLRQKIQIGPYSKRKGENLELRKDMASIRKLIQDQNVYIFPRTPHKFEAHIGLYSLLPRHVLEKFGLPLFRRNLWPGSSLMFHRQDYLGHNFLKRFESAFAYYIWPFINSGSPLKAFAKNEPTKLLAHNLDFWLPHITCVIQHRLSAFRLVEFENQEHKADLHKVQKSIPPNEAVTVERCRMGGSIWCGEDEAHEATLELVRKADKDGQLNALLDAIKSNRVEEDFSDRWSYAREDFERKLYKKRQKIKIRFVELDEAYGVVGPESDLSESLLWNDFFSLLETKEKQIVVCLTKGTTNLTEIAKSLGYANHSPISKSLARIRQKAKQYLDS